MTAEEDIQYIERLYPNFVEKTNSKIEDFWKGKYNTFDEDTDSLLWVKRDFVQKNLDLIRKYYAFIQLIDEIQHSSFVEAIVKTAEKYHFRINPPLIQAYKVKEMLALDLALHFPIWGRETYSNHDFRVIGFSREKKMGDFEHFTEVGVVPILKISVTKDNDLESIKPYDFRTISFGLKIVFKED